MTARRRRRRDFPTPDPEYRTVVKYFVYYLLGADGEVIYVGRSCNVAGRIRDHFAKASHPMPQFNRNAQWVHLIHGVTMTGPYNLPEAHRRERAAIERHQPRGNRMFTERHGWRPLTRGGGRLFGGGPHSQPEAEVAS